MKGDAEQNRKITTISKKEYIKYLETIGLSKDNIFCIIKERI